MLGLLGLAFILLVLALKVSTGFSEITEWEAKKLTIIASSNRQRVITIDNGWKKVALFTGKSQRMLYLISMTLGIITGPIKKPSNPPIRHKMKP